MKFNQVTWYSKLLALVIFITLPFVGFWLGVQYQKVTNPPSVNVTTSRAAPKNNSKTVVDSQKVKLKTIFKDGTLNYSGSVQLPTPCHKLNEDVRVLESFPEQVQIRLTIEDPDPGTFCAQVIAEK